MISRLKGRKIKTFLKISFVLIFGSWSTEALAIFSGTEEFDLFDLDTESQMDSEYFSDLLAYSFDWDWEEVWLDSDIGYRISGGSLTSKGLYVYQEGKIHHQLTPDFRFQWDLIYLGDPDRDLFHQTIEAKHRIPFTSHLFFHLGGEVAFKKQDADAFAGLSYGFDRWNFIRVTGTLVDFVLNRKDVRGEEDEVATTSLDIFSRLSPGPWRITLDGELDTPLERRMDSQGIRFLYYNLFGKTEVIYKHDGNLPIGAMIRYEENFRGTERLEQETQEEEEIPPDVRFRRRAIHGKLFARYRIGEKVIWDFGIQVMRRSTHVTDKTSPELTHSLERIETDPYVEAIVHLWEMLRLDLGYYMAFVQRDWDYPNDPARTGDKFHIQNKLKTAMEIVFSEKARLMFNVTSDLDRFGSSATFDGGNVQFVLGF